MTVHRIPPEIWTKILSHLHDSKDVESMANASKFFRSILTSSQPSWPFPIAFPLIFEHLSREEILGCRLVSKTWCLGVDQFLETNPFHRPALETYGGFNTHLRLGPLKWAIESRHFDYNKVATNITTKMGRLNLVGRSLHIIDSEHENGDNMKCLQVFGESIWFLKIDVDFESPFETGMLRVLEFTSYTPNLKKLHITGKAIPTGHRAHDRVAHYEEISNLLLQSITWMKSQRVPQLETLELNITGDTHSTERISAFFLALFNQDKLRSLSWHGGFHYCDAVEIRQLTDLSIFMDSVISMGSLLKLKGMPMERLSVRLEFPIHAGRLFLVISQFAKTLKDLHVTLPLDFYSCGSTDSKYSTSEVNFQRLSAFMITNESGNALLLRRLSLEGVPPLSYNFLLGLRNNLEYLHISTYNFRYWDNKLTTLIPPKERSLEVLDLLDRFRKLCASTKNSIYESNVWDVFPKLKVLTMVVTQSQTEEWEFRRDVFDKIALSKQATSSPQ